MKIVVSLASHLSALLTRNNRVFMPSLKALSKKIAKTKINIKFFGFCRAGRFFFPGRPVVLCRTKMSLVQGNALSERFKKLLQETEELERKLRELKRRKAGKLSLYAEFELLLLNLTLP